MESNHKLSRSRPGLLIGRVKTGTGIRLLTMLIVALVAHGVFFAPALFMDDWTSVIERVVTGTASWVDPEMRRPLLFIPFLVQHNLFGVNLPVYYGILWVLYLIMAIQVGVLVDRFAPSENRSLGLVTALLFLVYPTNFTHMWLIMLGVYVATILTLFYAIFWLKFSQTGRWRDLLIGLLCLVIPLGLYEGQLGVAAAWAGIVFLVERAPPWRRRLLTLLPVVVLASFALWRTFGFQSAGVADPYLAQVVTDPAALAERLLLGYKVTLVWGWRLALGHLVPAAAGTVAAVGLLAVAVAGLLLIARLTIPTSSRSAKQSPPRTPLLKRYALISAAGVLLVGAGYVPVITVFLPNLSGIGSRFNLFASIGGAVAITGLLAFAITVVGRSARQRNAFMAAAALPFVVLGITLHAQVQQANREAWQEQQQIWQQLFRAAPNFEDDTLVLFILPDFQSRTGFENMRRTPLSASWEASSAVRLLYNNFTLSGDVYFPDIDEPIEPRLTADGVLSSETGRLTPYSHTAAFTFDESSGVLSRLETLPASLVEGASDPVALCQSCVQPGEPPAVALRRLVR